MKPTRSPSPLSTQPAVWKNETRSRTKSSTDTLTAEIDVLYSQPPDFVSIRNDPFRLNNANAIDKQDSCCCKYLLTTKLWPKKQS
ncbi:hypothetical protein HDU79_007183 [Rhizoclosmatium sp. JEL0117]|nr:hypothetical protein HDU79_007183 [Rhizoclosmatium sp. JEL0117]